MGFRLSSQLSRARARDVFGSIREKRPSLSLGHAGGESIRPFRFLKFAANVSCELVVQLGGSKFQKSDNYFRKPTSRALQNVPGGNRTHI